ncbi:hypothetical protein H2201_007693 [Coniosporium apollinis]|uniref:Ketoreductase domain-containing protein n=1 Tax=Coniosporium apollinis TaxID=61459 RepID=A0ABQ9NMM1_9PEZI|nr:hypothetical protein H2201_007693 [Coniosporium apollinis]
MPLVIVVTGAATGFGALAARALAQAGHTVYAGIRWVNTTSKPVIEELQAYAAKHGVDLRAVEQDVIDDASVQSSIDQIVSECGRLDVVIHNAGHMSSGPAEAFSPEQLAQLYNINVLSTQRVNQAALPHMRKAGQGLVVWVSSSSVHGATPPFLAPYFAAKAAMDALAVSYAAELSQWGIETSIIVPGAFTGGTNHFQDAGQPSNEAVVSEYQAQGGPCQGVSEKVNEGLAALEPPDADVQEVADAIVKVVNMPLGQRPYRVHIDPSEDGSEVVSAVRDRVRREMYRRIGMEYLLKVKSSK